MRTKPTWLIMSAIALAAAACNSNVGGAKPGPCEGDKPAEQCNMACSTDTECGGGFHCGTDKTCTAECTAAGGECGDGYTCDNKGSCQVDDGNNCPSVRFQGTAVTPVVQLLIDQSGSMNQKFPNTSTNDPTRWDAVRNALISQTGVVTALENRIAFGATLYTSHNGNSTGACPILKNSAVAKEGNFTSIRDLLNANNPDDDTPTAEAVAAAATAFPAGNGPRILVLATDGIPDTCPDPDAHDDPAKALLAQQGSEQAVQNAFSSKSIKTFVLSVGPDVSNTHLQKLANAGAGLDINTGTAPFFKANNQAELNAAFSSIIGNARSCQFTLDAEVADATKGTVTLNGSPLALDTDWRLVNPTTLELIGGACDSFLQQDNVDLQAEFDCGGAVIIVK